ncbi:MAG: PaaI family thioesterase [Fimbriimonadaceae bacterium]|nr:PaaI family thioesterase [Alphaproteobacteria bacterium]
MSEFKIRNEDYAERVRSSFARQGFMARLGAEITSVAPGQVEIQVPYDRDLTQQHGFFHGGVIGTIADNAGGYASFSLMGKSDSVLTVEYKLNIMSPADGTMLISRGRVLRPGRRLTVSQSDVFVMRDGAEFHCATMLGTFMTLAQTSDKPAKRE